MKRYTLVAVTVLLIAAMLMSGCQQQGQSIPTDPAEAVRLIVDKQKEVKTQHSDISAELTLKVGGLPSDDPTAVFLKNFKADATVAGDIDNAGQNFSLKGSADLGVLTAFLSNGAEKLEFEAIKVGDIMYSRLADQEWTETPITSTVEGAPSASAADINKATEQFNQMLKKVAKAEKLADEAIDGADSYHFKVTLDAIELITEIAKLAEESGSDPVEPEQLEQAKTLLKDTLITLEMWVGKADLYIRQQKFHLTLDLKNIPDAPADQTVFAEFNLTLKNSKLNQPVTIAKP